VPTKRRRFRIRRATLRDLDALVHQRRGMWEDIADHTPGEHDRADAVYRAWARQRLKTGKLVAFLAEARDGRVVAGGCVWLRENQPRPGWEDREMPYLLSMYTEPEHREKGLASRIVREAVRWAKAQGYRRMTLHASTYGRDIYKRLGWERTWEMRIRLRRPSPGRSTRARGTPSGRQGGSRR
jgi:GNAT superfamily N-acetyltransferase